MFEDEARIGQKGRVCHRWWRRGKRPPGRADQRYTFAYIFAAVEPGTDNAFALVLPEVSTEAMQTYLMTSNTHFGLARKFVPVDPKTQTQIGSSGTNIQKFLKEGLIDGRAKVLRDFELRHPEVVRPDLSIAAR